MSGLVFEGDDSEKMFISSLEEEMSIGSLGFEEVEAILDLPFRIEEMG